MDNELHTLDRMPSCNTCIFWRPFSSGMGLCDMVNAPYDETKYDFGCNHWGESNEDS